MSDGPRMTLIQAERFAEAFLRRIGFESIAAAEQAGIEIVGSLRRRRDSIGDLDFIAPLPRVPEGRKIEAHDDPLFRAINAIVDNPAVDERNSLFVAMPKTDGAIAAALKGLSPGFRACELQVVAVNWQLVVKVNVYRYDAANYGWVKLHRTGPQEIGPWFLGRWKKAYGIPTGDERRQASKDGYLIDAGSNVVPVASEEEAFRLIGSNYVFPEARDRMCEGLRVRQERA